MDLALLDKLAPLADRLTSFALVLFILAAGAKGVWVYGSHARERLKEKDDRIKLLESKLETQERLIDRLSGLAERSTELARPTVIREIHDQRGRRAAASSDG